MSDNIVKLAEHERANKPEIEITAGDLAPIASQAEDYLIEAGVPLYQRGGALVRPIIETVDASQGRTTEVAQLKLLDAVYMRDLLSRYIRWRRQDGRKGELVRVDPPMAVAATILARAGDWRFPTIAGVVSTPTMRPDGSLLTEPGFDAATRLLLVAEPALPSIPDRPTPADALEALTLLEGLLTEFPFVDETARAVSLSAMITPVVRGAFPVAPMHVARAPTPGSGKSYLWDVVASIAIGYPMPVMAAGRNEEETEKRLGAAVIAAQPLLSLDNVNGELGGDALCQMVERPVVRIRFLGKSEQTQIETRGMSLYANGNNVTITGDLVRRVITATLDPQLERPELREFKGSPVATVLADRGAYIAACLTICRAYVVADRPMPAQKLASFEGWSDTVRSALLWLGRGDCVDSMMITREEDPARNELRTMLVAWAEAIGTGPEHRLTLAAAIESATGSHPDTPTHPELFAAVRTVGAHRQTRQPDVSILGRWMQRRKGRILDGMRFMSEPNPKGGSKWWVDCVYGLHGQTHKP